MANPAAETVPMDPETVNALNGSIKKWERVLSEGTDGTNWMDCPLCLLFWEKNCNGCPVRDRTGRPICQGSPFEQYADARDAVDGDGVDEMDIGEEPSVIAAAQAELDFLKSLLPRQTP